MKKFMIVSIGILLIFSFGIINKFEFVSSLNNSSLINNNNTTKLPLLSLQDNGSSAKKSEHNKGDGNLVINLTNVQQIPSMNTTIQPDRDSVN